jgi:hypothetical protein
MRDLRPEIRRGPDLAALDLRPLKVGILIVLATVGAAVAGTWWTVEEVDGRAVKKWLTINCFAHTNGPNEFAEDYAFPTNELKFWKKSGADWVSMTPAEQAAVVNAEKDVKASFDNWKTNTVDGETLAAALRAIVICMNRRVPGTNKITEAEVKVELKKLL